MVMAREEQARAMNVRDYAQIGAVEVNRMGDRQLYLVLLPNLKKNIQNPILLLTRNF